MFHFGLKPPDFLAFRVMGELFDADCNNFSA